MKILEHNPEGLTEVPEGMRVVNPQPPEISGGSFLEGLADFGAAMNSLFEDVGKFDESDNPENDIPEWYSGQVAPRHAKEVYNLYRHTLEEGIDPEEKTRRQREHKLAEVMLRAKQGMAEQKHQEFVESGLSPEQYSRKLEMEKLDDLLTAPGLNGVVQGAISLGGQTISTLSRVIPGLGDPDEPNRVLSELEGQLTIQDEGVKDDRGWAGFGAKSARRAIKSLTEMAPAGVAGGMSATIAQASVFGANSAYTQAKDAGLEGSKAASYAVGMGAIEGSIMYLFGKIGGPTMEEMLAGMGGRGAAASMSKFGLRDVVKSIASETTEEGLTEFTQAVLDRFSGVDPDALKLENIVPRVTEAMGAGALGAAATSVAFGATHADNLADKIESMKSAEQLRGFMDGWGSTTASGMVADISRRDFSRATGQKKSSSVYREGYVAGLDSRDAAQRQIDEMNAQTLDERLKQEARQAEEMAAEAPLEPGVAVPDMEMNSEGKLDRPGGPYENTPEMRKLVAEADYIRGSLQDPEPGYVRLWRGDKEGETFTDSLEGALPEQKSSNSDLSYVDVPSTSLDEWATESEGKFKLPPDLADVAVKAETPLQRNFEPVKSVSQSPQVTTPSRPATNISGLPIDTLVGMPTVEVMELGKRMGALVRGAKLEENVRGMFTMNRPMTVWISRVMGMEPEQMKRTLAHEVGHLIDFLPHMKSLDDRGNIIGHLANFAEFRNSMYKGMDAGNIYEEAKQISWWWRPFDEQLAAQIAPDFLQYRKSTYEIYADVMSTFLNSPGDLQMRAPRVFKIIVDTMSSKPKMIESYLKLQSVLQGRSEDVSKRRADWIFKMFHRGDQQILSGMESDRLANETFIEALVTDGYQAAWDVLTNDTIPKFKALLMNRGAELIKRQEDAGKVKDMLDESRGVNLYMELEKLNRIQGISYAWLERVGEFVYRPLKEAGLTDNELGLYLMHRRIMNDRGEILNPEAYIPEESSREIDALRADLGEEKFAVLRKSADTFYDLVFEVGQMAHDNDIYSDKLWETVIVPNSDSYAAFGVLKYLDNHISWSVKKAEGTFESIGNPFRTTVMKMIATIHAAQLNRSKTEIIANHLMRDDPGALSLIMPKNFIEQATVKRALNERLPRLLNHAIPHYERTPKGYKRTRIMFNGVQVEVEVPAAYVEMFDRPEASQDAHAVKLLNSLTYGVFYKLFINWNPEFALRNVFRDFERTYTLLGSAVSTRSGQKPVTMREIIGYMIKNLPVGHRRAMGQYDEKINEMMASTALDAPYTRRSRHEDMGLFDSDQFREVAEKAGLLSQMEGRTWLARGIKMLENSIPEQLKVVLPPYWIDKMEAVSKAAAYDILTDRGFTENEIITILTNNVGTPNTRYRGTKSDWLNGISMFFSTRMANLRAHWHASTMAPVEYTKRMAIVTAFDLATSKLARAGFFGAGIATMMSLISEDEEDRNHVVPLFLREDDDGETKVVYLAVPRDQTSSFARTLLRALYDAGIEGEGLDLAEVMQNASSETVGTLSPTWDILQRWGEYSMGITPRDSYFHRDIVSDAEMRTGGWASNRKMIAWTISKFGAIDYYAAPITRPILGEAMAEGTSDPFETTMHSIPYASALFKTTNRGHANDLFDRAAEADRISDEISAYVDRKSRRLAAEHSAMTRIKKDLKPEEIARFNRLHFWYQGIYLPYRAAMRDHKKMGQEDQANQMLESLKQITVLSEQFWAAEDRNDEQEMARIRSEMQEAASF